jgi:hypothetical protein
VGSASAGLGGRRMEFGSEDKATRRVIGPRQIAMFGRCWFVSDSPLRSPPCLAPLPPHSILLLAGAELSSSPSSLSPTSSLSLCFRPLYLSRSSLHARTLLGRPRTAGTGAGAAQGSGPPAAPVHTGSRFLPRGRPRCAVSHVRCARLRSPRGTDEPATWLLCSTAGGRPHSTAPAAARRSRRRLRWPPGGTFSGRLPGTGYPGALVHHSWKKRNQIGIAIMHQLPRGFKRIAGRIWANKQCRPIRSYRPA